MTGAWMEYLLRLTLIWAALLIYYHFFFSQNDNWALKRRFLLGAYLLGLVIPSLPAIGVATKNLPLSGIPLDTYFVVLNDPFMPQTAGPFAFSWPLLLMGIYLLGTLVQLIRLSRHFLQLWYWNREGIKSSFGPFVVVRHASISSPFAAWSSIFLPLHLAPKVEEVAYLHEAAHLQHAHTTERLPMILGQVFLWFHPLQWLFNRELSAIQEFQADEVVTQVISQKEYGHILIQQSMLPLDHWQPGLFASPLKKRIYMMIRKKNKQPWRLPQLGLFLGLLGLLVFSCSDIMEPSSLNYDNLISHLEADQVPTLVTSDGSDQPENILLETIYRNIRYPATARNNGVEGLAVAGFIIDEQGKLHSLTFWTRDGNYIVDKHGKLSSTTMQPPFSRGSDDMDQIVIVGYGDSKQEKSKTPGDMQILVEELARVISELPDWTPAQKEHQAVPVFMDLAFRFKLE